MDNPTKKSPISWPILAGGACIVLALFACGLSVILGASGLWLATRPAKVETTKVESVSALNLSPETAAVQEMRGWVEVQDKNSQWSPASEGQVISVGQHIRTGQLSSASLVFADGSRALLQAASELSIDELNAPSSGKKRVIVLTQQAGESDHEVAPNKLNGSRYEVHTPSGSGQAKGTKFHVTVTAAQVAYFYVTEGTVAVTGMGQMVLVNVGQLTIVYLNKPPLEPFMSVTGEGVVTQTGDTWIIAGQSFKVNESTILSGDPKAGDWVMVKGHLLADGSKVADWISKVYTPPVNQFRLVGKVEAIGATEWKVNGQAITVNEDTEIAADLKVGDLVRVEGSVLAGGKLQASSIQRAESETGTPFDFTGVVGETGETAWTISGVKVTVNATTKIAEGLKAGDTVRVKGLIQTDGTWLAESIQPAADESRAFAFTGTLESKNPWKVSGIAFETRDWTEIAQGLTTGDLVRVEGFIDENGIWIATSIEKLSDELTGKLILIGTVISTNPWVISGIPININSTSVIQGEIKVGMLVRVELVLQPDGTWLAVSIQPLSVVLWFPGCMDVIATVVSINGSQLQLQNWPLLTLDDGIRIEVGKGEDEQGEDEGEHDEDEHEGGTTGVPGTLAPGNVVRIRLCFGEDMTIRVTYIIIIVQPTTEEPQETGSVTVCHKPDKKKGGHTLTIDRSALPAHLGHGDTVGGCR